MAGDERKDTGSLHARPDSHRDQAPAAARGASRRRPPRGRKGRVEPTAGHGLESQIEEHNQQVRKDLYKRLLAMKPGEFEILVSLLLTEMGFETVEVTKLSGDGGIDVRGTLVVGEAVRIKMAVQAKRWKNNVQAPVVQQVRGSLGAHEQGLIITTSDFSPGAVKEAAQPDKTPIALMNGEQLVMLLMEHDIGVLRSTPDLFELDEDTLATRARE